MGLQVNLKRILIGRPLRTAEAVHERLTNAKALAVFSSDALSSVAYATEAILSVLIVAGSGVLGLSLPIALAICGLLLILTLSYRQTIAAYPKGGGAYIVTRDNLGTIPSPVFRSCRIYFLLRIPLRAKDGVALARNANGRSMPSAERICCCRGLNTGATYSHSAPCRCTWTV